MKEFDRLPHVQAKHKNVRLRETAKLMNIMSCADKLRLNAEVGTFTTTQYYIITKIALKEYRADSCTVLTRQS